MPGGERGPVRGVVDCCKTTKATRSIFQRHPELEVDPTEVVIRFTSKAQQRCIRITDSPDSPRFEIHLPAYGGVAMSDTPPFNQITHLAWNQSPYSYEEVCELLDIPSRLRFDALYLSEYPPIDPPRSDVAGAVYDSEANRNNPD